MSDQVPSPAPVSHPEISNEQRKALISQQLDGTQRTKRIYSNIISLVSDSTYRGEICGAIMEVLNHCRDMVGNLENQEKEYTLLLNPPKPTLLSPGQVRKLPAHKKKGKKK